MYLEVVSQDGSVARIPVDTMKTIQVAQDDLGVVAAFALEGVIGINLEHGDPLVETIAANVDDPEAAPFSVGVFQSLPSPVSEPAA